MRQRSSNIRPTPCASFDGSGYANRNFHALSTNSNKYSLVPACDVFGNIWKSTSSTFHDSTNLAGSMAMRWRRDRFLRLHPHKTRYLACPYTYLAIGMRLAAATASEPPWVAMLAVS